MSSHLTSKEIDYLASGLASVKEVKKAQEHLDSCARCRMIVDTLSRVVAAQVSDAVPGDHVRDAVLSEWHRLYNESVEKRIAIKPRIKRFMAGIAVAASVVIAVSAYLFFSIPESGMSYPLSITSAAGEIYSGNSPVSAGTPIAAGSVIKTGEDSAATVSSDNYNLYIGRSSVLEVSGNSVKSGIRFRLGKGSVVSKSSGSLHYSFECGGFKITPAGTEFLLDFSGDKLDIAVTEGKILITGPGVHISIAAEYKWSSGIPGKIELLDGETASLIKSVVSGSWPDEKNTADEVVKKSDPGIEENGKAEDDKTVSKKESLTEEKDKTNDKKEKPEKLKLRREIRDEINAIKKERRKERKSRNKD